MVVTFSEYVLRQEYSNLIEQYETLLLNDGFLYSEQEDRYGIRGAAQNLGQGMRNLGKDAMQAAGSAIRSFSSSAMNLIQRKAKELMSMGMEKLQAVLAKKGYPNLLATLNKYKNGLMILGIMAAGGIMALGIGGGNSINPDAINDALQLPRGSFEQFDKDIQKGVLEGLNLTKEIANVQQDVNQMQTNLNSLLGK